MTVCNMSIEAGARAGMIAPDETTYAYLTGRPRAPQGAAWDAAVERWRALPTDAGARFDRDSTSTPRARADDHLRHESRHGDSDRRRGARREPTTRAFAQGARVHGDSRPASRLHGKPVDVVFIGCCTNARLSDLRVAAGVLRGRHVAQRVRVLVVPGSQQVKRQAEAEGLDQIFSDAGAEWREAGCSMCIAMNGDQVGRASSPSARATATSRAARAAARARCSRARSPPPRPPSPARSPTRASSGGGDAWNRSHRFARRTVVLAERQHRHRPDHPGALPHDDDAGRARRERCSTTGAMTRDGTAAPRFVLNTPESAGRADARGGHNFGCGSSREHAPWALLDFGFRAVVSTSSPTSSAATR